MNDENNMDDQGNTIIGIFQENPLYDETQINMGWEYLVYSYLNHYLNMFNEYLGETTEVTESPNIAETTGITESPELSETTETTEVHEIPEDERFPGLSDNLISLSSFLQEYINSDIIHSVRFFNIDNTRSVLFLTSLGSYENEPIRTEGLSEEEINNLSIEDYSLSKEESCTICLSKICEGNKIHRISVCSHLFHAECLIPWLRLNKTCPLCRKNVM